MPNSSIVVAGVPEHFNLPWHLGVEQSAFAEAGVDLTYRDYPGGTGAMTQALAEQEVDMAVLLTEGAIADLVKRRQTKLVKVYVQSPLIWGIHVAANSKIQSIDDTQGKRYAISRFGSGSHLMAIVDAAERKWDTDLSFEVVKNLDGARQALADGDADVFMWEQFTTQPLVDNGAFRRVGIRKTLWPAFVIAVNESFLQKNASSVQAALKVINQQSSDLMQAANAVSMIAKRYRLRVEQVKQWFELTSWDVGFECPEDAIKTTVSYLQRLKIIEDAEVGVDEIWHAFE